ncbi:hypothetical protein [Pontibacter beigongshangensis]|uniref:hypothetical protein n=1 Tax=Pontibacter beigongshangensis TaxID=2574733 RepID=UPI00164F61AD|nr:hypothetical protein [Pontibacter beigongshangensis]
MNLLEFTRGLQRAADELKTEGAKIVRRTAMDSIAVVERRVKEQGIEGATYKSKGKVPYFSGGRKTGAFKDYATHGKVDLTLSNRMWNGIAVLGTTTLREGVFQAQVGGTDQEVDDKIIGNMRRFGDFLQPNDTEQAELLEDSRADVLDIIKKHIT